MSQIDWSKPVYCRNSEQQDYIFVGYRKDRNYAVVESGSGMLLTVNTKSGLSTCWPLIQLENRLEPWEEAWEKHKEECNPMFYREEDYFKKVFELGRTWDTNQNKKS